MSTNEDERKAFEASDMAESIAKMVAEWVDGGISAGTDWRPGLPQIIKRRFARATHQCTGSPGECAHNRACMYHWARPGSGSDLPGEKATEPCCANCSRAGWWCGRRDCPKIAEKDKP